MPNHCDNRIEIYCKTVEQAKEIKDFLCSEETCFDLNNIVPKPNWSKTPLTGKETDFTGAKQKLGKVGELPIKNEEFPEGLGTFWEFASTGKQDDRWYNWQIINWGTKWNTYDAYEDGDEDELIYHFNTAWSPPEEAIEALRKIYTKDKGVHITAWFDEPGMEIGGYY
tara:strand:+ start:1906 stop:2409 length:504 start_codon:yes stop_codon:yes gene_type:complete